MSGVRTLGSVMLAPGGGAWGGKRPGKGFLLEGERDKSGLLGVTLGVESELGALAVSYAEEEDEEEEEWRY